MQIYDYFLDDKALMLFSFLTLKEKKPNILSIANFREETFQAVPGCKMR